MALIYSARWLLPITSPPIHDGAIAIQGETILANGPRAEIAARFPEASASHFDDAVIMPGLVNAHSHLELTVMRGFLENEESDFVAWLKKLTAARMAMTAEDLLVSSMCGAMEAARAGITCVADSSSFATLSMRALKEIGLRGIVYQESFGPDANLAEENVAKLRDQIREMRARETDQVRAGVSPHAPYTVSGHQIEMISRLAMAESLPVMMHAAESESECVFMIEGRGPFADGLKKRGIQWEAPGISTVRYLHERGLLDTKPLLAHCINCDDQDLGLIKAAGAGVAHCPKSNAKLRHGRAPFRKFLQAGINTGLGSDSVASNNNCDILEEARFATLMARLDRDVEPMPAQEALFAATLGGARALGLNHQIGALEPGKQADIAIVSMAGIHQRPVANPVDALVFSSSGRDVMLTVVAGRVVYRRDDGVTASERELRNCLGEMRMRLELCP